MERVFLDAAHELRTPLTRIRGEIDLILRSDVSDPPRSQLERIQEDLERLSRLCGRLLLLARLDRQAGDAGLPSDEVDLEGLVSELLEQMTPLAQDCAVSLRRGATSAARVRGSRPLLVEALLNLLDYALRSTPEGGPVSVSIDVDGSLVRVAVADGSAGIPPAERERILQRLDRIPRTPAGGTYGDDGNDLGLAIVRGIARVHGGRFELDEAPGGGSLFRLVLPVCAVS